MTPPVAAMALLQEEAVPPIDSMERRIYQLEARIVGLTRTVEALVDRQDTVNDEIREALDRVYRVLDNETEEEGV